MRPAVKIAQAPHSPELLILDEPFTGADPIARHDLTNLFRELRQGVGILVSAMCCTKSGSDAANPDDRPRADRRGAMCGRAADAARSTSRSVSRRSASASQLAGWEMVTGVSVPQPDTVLFETAPEAAYERLTSLILDDGLTVRRSPQPTKTKPFSGSDATKSAGESCPSGGAALFFFTIRQSSRREVLGGGVVLLLPCGWSSDPLLRASIKSIEPLWEFTTVPCNSCFSWACYR